jgi:hypothetical protein
MDIREKVNDVQKIRAPSVSEGLSYPSLTLGALIF